MEHELQKLIVQRLIHAPRAQFNELWNKDGESNVFAYHLKKLEEQGVIEKFADGYGLTPKGRELSTFIEGETGELAKLPTPTVIMLVRQGSKFLCQRRLKEPFYGYWGFLSGKINFGWNPVECAVRDLKEEAGLEAKNARLKALSFVKTYEQGKILHHHLMYIVEITEVQGQWLEKTHKAENAWLTADEYLAKERFPDTWFSKELMSSSDVFVIEAERFMEAGKFAGYTVIRKERLQWVPEGRSA